MGNSDLRLIAATHLLSARPTDARGCDRLFPRPTQTEGIPTLRRSRVVALLLVCVCAAACGEDGPTDPPDLEATAILEVVAGEFGGTVAAPADPQPAVRVVTPEGASLPGVEVSWTPDEGDGTAASSTATGTDGVARPDWVLGERAGVQRINARLANGEKRTIEATAAPGPVHRFEGPEVFSVEVNESRPVPVRLFDVFDNEVPLSRASWSVVSTDLASVDGSGVVSGLEAGRTELHVAANGLRAEYPLEVHPLLRLVDIEVGNNHACGLTGDDAAYCWGSDASGQLGAGGVASGLSAVRVIGPEPFAALSLGAAKSCAVSISGKGYCWGDRSHALLGDGVGFPSLNEPHPIALDLPLRSLETGIHDTECAVTTDGGAYCWGHNDFGQVGQGFASATVDTPQLLPVDGPVRETALSLTHGCALLEDGSAWCWGSGGLGHTVEDPPRASPPAPVAGDHEFTELVRGTSGTCGVTAARAAWCWGGGSFKRAFEPGLDFQHEPTVLGELRFEHLGIGRWHACGILSGGEPVCWSSEEPVGPSPVSGVANFAVGWFYICALDAQGAPWCWGGDFGPTPTRVYERLPPA